MRKDSIDIMGARENLEKVKDFAWTTGKFGSTWLEGKWLYIANAADAETLYRQLQEICFQNDIELCVDGEIILRDEDGNDIDSFEEV